MRRFIVVCLLIFILFPVTIRAQDQSCTHTASDVDSLLAVQNTIRTEVSKGLSKNIVVCLNGGNYFLNSPLRFDSKDSGTSQYTITYQSTPGQKAVISGGKIITTPWTKTGPVWTNTLGDNVSFRHLYLDNTSLPRASQAFTIASVNGQQITVNEAADFSNLSPDAELLALGIYSSFRENIVSGNGKTITAATLMGIGSYDAIYPSIAPQVGQPVFIENDPRYLDQPSEWALSASDKTIKYFPQSIAENPNSKQFIYPNLDQLLIINGSKNLKFNNLTFAHSKWTLPDHGYDGQQAGINTTSPSISHFDSPAILIENTSNLEFNSNTFWHLGSHGLTLGQSSDNIKIDGNLFTDIGGNSIMVGYRPHFFSGADWIPISLAPLHNNITNNTIYSTANEMWDSVGIFAAFSGDTNISNNLIHDLPYSGISAGLSWTYSATSMKNTTIQNNLIYHTNQKLTDGGGIYVLGNQSGSLMSNNAVTDIFPPPGSPVAGMYFDNGSIGWTVRENIGNWWCSDCQPNHVPTDSPSNFNLVSNNTNGYTPAKYYITPNGQVRAESGIIITTDSNCYNSLVSGDYYFPKPNIGENHPCQTTANALSNYFLLQGLTYNNWLGQNEKWIYGYQPRVDWAPFGPKTTQPPPPATTQTPIPTPTDTSLPLDIDRNGKVDIFDYNILFSDFGKTGKPGFVPSDLTKDGKVDMMDYTILVSNFEK